MASQVPGPDGDVSGRRSAKKLVTLGFVIGSALALLLMYLAPGRVLRSVGSFDDARELSRAVVLVDEGTLVQDGKSVGHLDQGVVLVRRGSAIAGAQELTLHFACERTVGPRFQERTRSGLGASAMLVPKNLSPREQ